MELLRALGALAEPPGDAQQRIADALELGSPLDPAEYTALFTLQLYPYASVYTGNEGMLGGEALDRVAGFWRALGLAPPAEPDHVASILGLCAELTDRARGESDAGRAAALERARTAFVWEHVLSWMPLYARKMRSVAGEPYAAWAELLECALADLGTRLEPPQALPLHLREAAPVADPRADGAHAFIASLLAPVRSGAITVRDDLARAARDAGLGLRHGERRFVLTSFLAQDRVATLGWLESAFRAAAREYAEMEMLPAAIRAHWIDRAGATATLLDALRVEAQAEERLADTVP